MSSVRLVLCRHTQTDFNAEGRIAGHVDVPLNAEGKRQADAVADKLALHPIRAVASSTLRRATAVAERIAERHRLMVIPDPRLCEVHFGAIQGTLEAERRTRFPDDRFHSRRPGFDFRSIGGESHGEMLTRTLHSLDDLANTFGNSNGGEPFIAVVGHGCSFTHLLKYLGVPDPLHPQGSFQIVEYSTRSPV